MTVGMLEDAVKACRISMELYHEKPTIVNLGRGFLHRSAVKAASGNAGGNGDTYGFYAPPELTVDGIYGEANMDKQRVEKRSQRESETDFKTEAGGSIWEEMC